MLNLPGRRGCNCEGPTRRELLRIGSLGMMGLSLPHFFFWREAHAAQAASKYAGARGWESAKNVVMVFLQGGPSHIDIWDPKPDAPSNIRGEFKPIKTKIPGTWIGEHMPMMAEHLDKATLDPLDELYAERPVQSHRGDLPDADRLSAGPGLAVGSAGAALACRLSDCRESRVEAEAADRSGAAVRRTAAPAAGIGHYRQGRQRRIPGQGLRSLPHVSGPGQADQAGGSLAAQGHPAGTPEGPLRAAQRHQRVDAGPGEGLERLRRRRILRQGLRSGALGQSARRHGPGERIARNARAVRSAHVRAEPAHGAPADRSGHEVRAGELAFGGQRQSGDRPPGIRTRRTSAR